MWDSLTVIILAKLLTLLGVSADTYSVKVGTESHVNVVDTRFLSFTIDPKYLFSTSGKYKTKECICMASSLTPAYIRIAGPSTSQMTFHNSTISIDAVELLDEGNSPEKVSLDEYQSASNVEQLAVTHEDWGSFVRWAKGTGFDLVFALNNQEKTSSGMWDPNTALDILTVADKAGIGDMYWQLGYECNNQSIEEYLNDLETLRVITETFPAGRGGRWRTVGGDVTPCLAADSKSDFKDYVTLSDEMFDAVFLNGNSSSQELQRMSEKDRLKLLKVLSRSSTPLWLTETHQRLHELERAADWMTSLGYSAKNGFAVHFRELVETELYEPTLSFYMALLFKNLVGEKVLNVDIEASEAIMFAHCTSLRHKPVPGAVTLFGANMDTEPARFSVKLSKKEEGGDIMQFILGHDHSGNIIVNGRAMYYEGDIKPIVKRVRPYKTLLINLPPKSFGFWVLANTQVDACYDTEDKSEETQYVEALPITSVEDDYSKVTKIKRSISKYDIGFNEESLIDFVELLNETDAVKDQVNDNKALQNRIHDLNNDLMAIHNMFPSNEGREIDTSKTPHNKVKREAQHTEEQNTKSSKPRKRNIKSRIRKQRNHDLTPSLKSKLLSKLRNSKLSRFSKNDFNRISKRNPKNPEAHYEPKRKNMLNKDPEPQITNPDCDTLRKRKRRSTDESMIKNIDSEENRVGFKNLNKFRNLKHNHMDDDASENVVFDDTIDNNEDEGLIPAGKVLHKLKKISRFPVEVQSKHVKYDVDDYEYSDDVSDGDEIILKTKFLGDSAIVNIKEKSKSGFLRSTIQEVLSVFNDLNKKIDKAWSTLTYFE